MLKHLQARGDERYLPSHGVYQKRGCRVDPKVEESESLEKLGLFAKDQPSYVSVPAQLWIQFEIF